MPQLHVISDRDYPLDRTAGEKETLTTMLDWVREGVRVKVVGLSDEAAARRLVESDTTAVGIVKHLAYAEDIWFTHRFADRPMPEPFAGAAWDDDPDWEFNSAPGDGLAACVELYEAACARSREVAAAAALEQEGHQGRVPYTLRYVLIHMIVETARHLGHLDILREQTDGGVGP